MRTYPNLETVAQAIAYGDALASEGPFFTPQALWNSLRRARRAYFRRSAARFLRMLELENDEREELRPL